MALRAALTRRLHAVSGVGLKKLGKYDLLGELGRGAFGVVYRARDPVINRMVALKTLTSTVAEDPNLLERFYREAQSAGALQHPNIVTIYDLGDEAGAPFIAMELVDGPNLGEIIARRSPLPLALRLGYAVQACRAFGYAHKRGIIHRDIKPGNVMVTAEDVVKVVDFGIARVLEGSKTQTGTLIGTFAYMAPELFHGAHASERSDIGSFGVLLYELFAYQAPFAAASPAALMKIICQQEPVRARQLVRDCPEDLDSVVHRALRKNDTERYAGMEDMLLDLEPIWKRLQVECVGALLEQSRRMMGQNEFVVARDLLRQALRVDNTNPEARALLEKVNVALTRIAVRPKVQQCVDKARDLLRAGNLQAAALETDNALRLDSQFSAAHELLDEIRKEKERLKTAGDYIQLAKQRLVGGLPDEAEALLLKAREICPMHAELPQVEQQICEEQKQRQRRKQVQDGLQQARLLWTQRKYEESIQFLLTLQNDSPGETEVMRLLETIREDQAEEIKRQKLAAARSSLAKRDYDGCIATLEKLAAEFPGDNEIRRLLQLARDDRAEQNRRERMAQARKLLSARRYEDCIAVLTELQQECPKDEEIQRLMAAAREDQTDQEKNQTLAKARDLLAGQHFADALAALEPLLASDPSDSAVLKVRSLVLREQQERAKSEVLRREWESLRNLTSNKAYAEVITRGESLLREFPGNPEVSRLVEFARSEQAQIEYENRLQSTKDRITALLDAGDLSDALAAARAALESFPDNPDISVLSARAQARQREAMVHEQLERSVREIKLKINRGQLTEAKELAQEALNKLGPDTDVRQLLWSAELEYDAREKKRRQAQKLEGVRAFLRAGKLTQATQALEEIKKADDFDRLDPRLDELAGEITGARQAAVTPTGPMIPLKVDAPMESKLDREYVVVEGTAMPGAAPAAYQPRQQAPTATPVPAAPPKTATPAIGGTPTPPHADELTPAAVDHAAHLLARYIGPISVVLAKRAAQHSESLRGFYELLADSIDTENERARFLQDAGLPEA